jgi:peroxiredoxin
LWRRVLSQSPSKAPDDPETARQTREYLDGWKALGALLHSGRSLSGRERNCCFLNLGNSRFVDVASAIGFDHPSDSRGIGVVDWDSDGDLDLWVTNRTSPRARYLQNDIPSRNHYVAFKLQGVTCNRDAIGARVELFTAGPRAEMQVRTLSAGEGFISQSSKWIHFGLGRTAIDRVIVHWPGGAREELRDITAGKRYKVVQGSGRAVLYDDAAPSGPLVASTPPVASVSRAIRVALAQRVPIPEIEFHDLQGKSVRLSDLRGRPLLINLWASWCNPCLEELDKWNDAHAAFADVPLAVLAVNVDHAADKPLDHLADVSRIWQGLRLPFNCFVIDAQGFELFEVVDRIHALHRVPLPIPASFLIDSDGRLAAVYKGPIAPDQVVRDARRLVKPHEDIRDAAAPFRGKWYSDPPPTNLTAVPLQLNGLGRPLDAFDYIMRYIVPATDRGRINTWTQLGVDTEKVLRLIHGTARLLEQSGRIADAVTMYQKALLFAPESWDTRLQLCSLLIRLDQSKEAMTISREMTRLNPDHPIPWNYMAWIMATTKDPGVRDPKRAVELAEKICKLTQYQEPTALDTLAVAYAAAGRFEEARITARKALAVAEPLGIPNLVQVIRRRLLLFEGNQPFVPDTESNSGAPARGNRGEKNANHGSVTAP